MEEVLTVDSISPGRKAQEGGLLEKFRECYRLMEHDTCYTTSEELVSVVDGLAAKAGYSQGPGLKFRYKNVETDYVLGTPSKEKEVRYPTLEYYPHVKGRDLLAQVLLYGSVGLQHNRIPTGILYLANEGNKDFAGDDFSMEALDKAHRKLLGPLSKKIEIKQIPRSEIESKLSDIDDPGF